MTREKVAEPLAQRTVPIAQVQFTEEEIEAAVAVLRSGKLVQGEKVRAFEEAFADQVDARYAVAMSSGSAALHAAYLAVLEPGSEVLVTTFTHISTASMVTFAGCQPIFCDIHPRTFNLDLADVKQRLTARTRAMVPVHLFGNACLVDEILVFAQKHGLRVIWDACQAHSTTYKGKDVGGFNDLVCYSFYPTKNLFVGEGGMVTTNDSAFYEKLRLLRSHGQEKKYYHPTLGFNYRMTEVEASIGLTQLQRLSQLIAQRRHNARYLDRELVGLEAVLIPQLAEGSGHSYHQYSILLNLEQLTGSRDEFQNRLRQKGVETAVHYPVPLHRQPAFSSLTGGLRLPVSEEVSRRILSLPVHPGLSTGDLAWVASAVKETHHEVLAGK